MKHVNGNDCGNDSPYAEHMRRYFKAWYPSLPSIYNQWALHAVAVPMCMRLHSLERTLIEVVRAGRSGIHILGRGKCLRRTTAVDVRVNHQLYFFHNTITSRLMEKLSRSKN